MASILFVIDTLAKGGAELMTIKLANHLSKSHQVTLAVLNNQDHAFSPSNTVTLFDLQLPLAFARGKLWQPKALDADQQCRLIGQLAPHHFDMILLGYNNGHWLAPYLEIHHNVWHWIHGNLLEVRPATNVLTRLKESLRLQRHQAQFKRLFGQRRLITVNRDLMHQYQHLVPKSTVISIANGVDTNALTQSLAQLPPLEQQWDMIFVGRLAKIKQIDHALHAFARSGLTGRMAIVGEGTLKSELHAVARQLGIEHRVDFLGWRKHPIQYIAAARCLVMSSYYEGFGLVIAEALAVSTPVVAYNTSLGIADQFDTQMQAGLVPPQDIDALAQAMYAVVTNPYPICLATQQRLDIDHMAQQFLQLLPTSVTASLSVSAC